MACECGNRFTDKFDSVDITNLFCDECGNTKAVIWSLPTKLVRATELFEGKELCEKAIAILVEAGYVTQIKQLPEG